MSASGIWLSLMMSINGWVQGKITYLRPVVFPSSLKITGLLEAFIHLHCRFKARWPKFWFHTNLWMFSQVYSFFHILLKRVFLFSWIVSTECGSRRNNKEDKQQCWARIKTERETTQGETRWHRMNTHMHAHTHSDRACQGRPNVYVYALPDNSEASMGRTRNHCVCVWDFRRACSQSYLSNKA